MTSCEHFRAVAFSFFCWRLLGKLQNEGFILIGKYFVTTENLNLYPHINPLFPLYHFNQAFRATKVKNALSISSFFQYFLVQCCI